MFRKLRVYHAAKTDKNLHFLKGSMYHFPSDEEVVVVFFRGEKEVCDVSIC